MTGISQIKWAEINKPAELRAVDYIKSKIISNVTNRKKLRHLIA